MTPFKLETKVVSFRPETARDFTEDDREHFKQIAGRVEERINVRTFFILYGNPWLNRHPTFQYEKRRLNVPKDAP